jgi:hypothetical protein
LQGSKYVGSGIVQQGRIVSGTNPLNLPLRPENRGVKDGYKMAKPAVRQGRKATGL